MELSVKVPVSEKISYKLQAKNLSYNLNTHCEDLNWVSCCLSPKRPPKFILKDVNCEARAKQITAIAGPSGAGKTTLLEILAGKIPPSDFYGQVLLNNRTLENKFFRRLSGYVTQDDALFPTLTVQETLVYSALLRLVGGSNLAAIRVKELLKELGLDHVANSRIGDISGGEKRRVSIGVELVHDPNIVLIDEPTSGLDSSSALHVITLLKSMVVHQGKTIVVTIHQPGFRILELFDRIILLSNGFVLHNGSLNLLEEKIKFSGHQIPRHVNVLEFSIDVIDTLVIQNSESLSTQYFLHDQNHVQENFLPYPNSHFQEILILGKRFSSNIFRTKQLFATRILQAIVAGLVLGSVFINSDKNQDQLDVQTRLGFFAFTLTFFLSCTSEGLPIFLQEKGILMRETSRGAYRVSSYVLANTLIFLPFLLMVTFLYTIPVYWLVGLRKEIDGFFYFSLVVWMVVLMSNSFVACFSALVPNFIMGTSIISGFMGSFFLFSGYFISEKNIPKYWIFMHYLSLFKYPFECFLVNEYGGDQGMKKCIEMEIENGHCKLFGNGFLIQQGIEESKKWSNLAVMLGFIVGYRLLCLLILLYKCYKIRN